ncbi:Gfo/Idh/MocA family oxidoreductase [Bacillus sp. FJAT-27251]|uniref:Gfo/Idh/MocA family protein n=1 Tax=Bacillus sp. FJAT-27251 TaxID=1684142 RepID=UPI0006A7ABDE|nr:Gfo/Idh/MocA family oxidoreductase [Bacillus sp. FJAT-27251]
MSDLQIGMIGLDTSHASAFTELLNDPAHPFHVKGGKVVAACPAGSPDFELSYSRIGGITRKVEQYGVQMVDSFEQVAEICDAILLESVDGRIHLQQVEKLAMYKKPIFIDKPLCLCSRDAIKMEELSKQHGVPIMSSSALRFAEPLRQALAIKDKGNIIGADCFGPMDKMETQPGYYWYGIHTIEMLYAIFGSGAQHVSVLSNPDADSDWMISQWKDGRIGTVRGNARGNYSFGALIHFEKGNEIVCIDSSSKPYYASLLEQVMLFFKDRKPVVPIKETKEIIRFIEAANESRETGRQVRI